MPFKAFDVDAEKIINSLTFSSKLELIATAQNIVCPYCQCKMHCRQRGNSALHFVHNSVSKNCVSGGEGWRHHECKRLIYSELESQIEILPESMKKLFSADLEYRLKEVGRIIDVVLLYNNIPVEAHEIQLSAISVRELEDRTKDYRSQGIAAYWYFGRKADTPEVQQWSKSKFGEVRRFNFQEH